MDPTDKTEDIKYNVLLVENDLFSIELILKILEDLCNVTVVKSGNAAVEEAFNKYYDAIIMDIHLGLGIDGVEVTRQIRSMPNYSNIPIIAVTAYAMTGDKEKFFDEGMTHYFAKPINVNAFYDLMKNILK